MIRTLMYLACLFLCACSTTAFDPDYRTDMLVYDEGLVGRWSVPGENGADRIEFAEKTRGVSRDGRVDTFFADPPSDERAAAASDRAGAAAGPTVRIYEVLYTFNGRDDETLVLNGYLTEIDGQRYLGVQVSFFELLGPRLPYPFVLPTHTYWRLDRRGDQLAILWPLRWPLLVAAATPHRTPPRDAEEIEPDGAWPLLFTSLHELREYYRRHAKSDGFFGHSGEFVRGK